MCRALVHVGAVEAFDDMEFFSLLFYVFHLCSTCVLDPAGAQLLS